VTDADLLLGYLNADYFLGGEMPLDVEAARRVIQRDIAERTGLELIEAIWGIHELVNQNMALAAKMHVLERGHDPTRYAMVAYGGAGPVHAYGMARALGVRKAIVPPSAGVAASLGLLVAPIAFDLVQTLRMPFADCEWDVLRGGFESLEEQGTATLREADVQVDDIQHVRNADMRFVGQGFEVSVPIPGGRLDAEQAAAILSAFQKAYRARYAHLPSEDDKIEFVRLRLRAWTPTPPPSLPKAAKGSGASEPLEHREAYFGQEKGYVKTPVFRWLQMEPGKTINGPAIVESVDTTVVVGPQGEVTMDEYLYLTIEMEGR
jgi:N-methylhydantoinase A/oxoprolinase/acetone carboxylase beta subunit